MTLRFRHGLATSWQLFFAIAGVGLLLVLVTLWGIRLYFTHNFHSYLSAQETQRVQSLATLMAEYYEAQRDTDSDFTLSQLGDLERGGMRRVLAGLSAEQWRSLEDDERTQMATRGRMQGWRSGFRDISLYDAQGERISGRSIESPIRVPIVVDGEVVGTLQTATPTGPLQPIDAVFAQQQRTALVVAGFIAIALAALVAALLAARLRRKVARLTAATRALARGHYDVEVPVVGADDFADLSQDLNALALALRHASQQRQAFMADVAHELRTPLTILQAELEAIEDGIRQLDVQQMGLLQNQVRQLTQLVEDIHTLADADAGSLKYAWQGLNITSWLQQLWPGLHKQAQSAGLEAQLNNASVPLEIQADPQRLAQLVHNVWANALRYTDVPGEVSVQLQHDQASVTLTIEDSAPGVPDEALVHLFERLYRVDNARTRVQGGSGLGLSICKRIAQAHRGRITAQHSPRGGLRVCLQLPRRGQRLPQQSDEVAHE